MSFLQEEERETFKPDSQLEPYKTKQKPSGEHLTLF